MAEFNTITELPQGIQPPRPRRGRRLTPSGRPGGPLSILTRHFFRRFFDNDTVQADADTITTVVRAVAFTAVPGLILGFFMQTLYGGRRTPWGAVEDQYLFLLISFITLGAVALFEWDMLFPDRLDFLILSPLPLRPRALFVGKISALAAFLGIFLVSANVFGALLLPAITHGQFYRQIAAHVLAASAAGIFAALFFLALGGLLLCVLGGNVFRTISPVVQFLSVTALALVLVHYTKSGDNLHLTLAGTCANPATPAPLMPDTLDIPGRYFVQHYTLMQPAPSPCPAPALGYLGWLPPIWFLGLYQHLLYGAHAPAFAAPMAARALVALGLVTLITFATYPVAWARMRRLALEGASRVRRPAPAWRNKLLHALITRPGERALFHFIGQTLARNNRYQVYFAVYSGTGVALALACAVYLQPGGSLARSARGLHAVVPLLLFWIIAGLRTAFAFPLSIAAGWIFRITGVSKKDCAAAGRRWTLLSALAILALVLVLFAATGWTPRELLGQAFTGTSLALLLADAFFFKRSVPFNQIRLPGRTNLPLVLTLYLGLFPPFIFAVIYLGAWLEQNLFRLVGLAAVVLGIHLLARLRDRQPDEIEEEMEGYEDEFQILGLS